MDKNSYEKRKAFAGKKKPSMKRRCVGHDYTRRGIYMVTLIVEGRKNLFGRVYGSSSNPRIQLAPCSSHQPSPLARKQSCARLSTCIFPSLLFYATVSLLCLSPRENSLMLVPRDVC